MFGIYYIKIADKQYIGSTSVSFKKRVSQHRSALKNQRHPNVYLQRLYNKYKEVEFGCIEIMYDKSRVLEKEQEYLDLLKPVLNLKTTATCNVNNANRDYTEVIKKLHAPECRAKARQALIDRYKQVENRKLREEMMTAKLGKKIQASDGRIFPSIREAARQLGCKAACIDAILAKGYGTAKGLTFKRL